MAVKLMLACIQLGLSAFEQQRTAHNSSHIDTVGDKVSGGQEGDASISCAEPPSVLIRDIIVFTRAASGGRHRYPSHTRRIHITGTDTADSSSRPHHFSRRPLGELVKPDGQTVSTPPFRFIASAPRRRKYLTLHPHLYLDGDYILTSTEHNGARDPRRAPRYTYVLSRSSNQARLTCSYQSAGIGININTAGNRVRISSRYTQQAQKTHFFHFHTERLGQWAFHQADASRGSAAGINVPGEAACRGCCPQTRGREWDKWGEEAEDLAQDQISRRHAGDEQIPSARDGCGGAG